jgi:hypothetical protein
LDWELQTTLFLASYFMRVLTQVCGTAKAGCSNSPLQFSVTASHGPPEAQAINVAAVHSKQKALAFDKREGGGQAALRDCLQPG